MPRDVSLYLPNEQGGSGRAVNRVRFLAISTVSSNSGLSSNMTSLEEPSYISIGKARKNAFASYKYDAAKVYKGWCFQNISVIREASSLCVLGKNELL